MANANDIVLDDNAVDITAGESNHQNEPNNPAEPAAQQQPEPINEPNEPKVDENKNDNDNLENGTVVEIDGESYTADENGNLLDKDGNVFKKAEEVKDFLAQFETESDDDKSFDISDLQSLVDVEVTDEDGKAIEFTNDAEGKKAFIEKVIELKQEEATKIALDTYFEKNPKVRQFADFVELGGNPYDFGKIPDRTQISFNPDDAEQHKQIIRIAFAENGRAGDVESYIKWLEAGGSLADTAKNELEGIKKADKARIKEIEDNAKAQREQAIEEQKAYLNKVLNTIESGKLGKYKLPENVTVEKNGQKLNYTRRDFYNYVTKIVDRDNDLTGYTRDLANLSDDEYLNRELLDAWIHFTGGSYQTLVDMAIREGEANKIRLTAKKAANRSNGTVKINKPNNASSGIKNVVL